MTSGLTSGRKEQAPLYKLGMIYKTGQGIEQDQKNAFSYFKQGHIKVQNELEKCYYEGRGIEQDYANAANWLSESASQLE